ncbi:hypothetical protein JCM10449v2_002310 [Rhodotorula kratochvilovae]
MPAITTSLHSVLTISSPSLDPRPSAVLRRAATSNSTTILEIQGLGLKDGELEVLATSLNGMTTYQNATRIDPSLQSLLFSNFFSGVAPTEIPRLLDTVRECSNAPPLVVLGAYYLNFTATHLATSGSSRLTRLQNEWDTFVDNAFDGQLANPNFDTGFTPIRRSPRLSAPSGSSVTAPSSSPSAPRRAGRRSKASAKH